jgi:predicted nucleic acid-binding protein
VYTVLLDSNILFSATMRDLILELAKNDVFHARWSELIHEEWTRAVLRMNSRADKQKLARTRRLIDAASGDALVTDFQDLIPNLELPDANDRHVLAAAIIGRCDAIVTKNLRHFPSPSLSRFGIEAIHPDQFLLHQISLAPDTFLISVRNVRMRLHNPPYSADEYLDVLTGQGLVATAAELRPYRSLL